MSCAKFSAIAAVLLCLLLVIASCLAKNCGKRKVPNFLIVNGIQSNDGYWPWHVAIFHRFSKSYEYVCGGTILDRNTVLTTAHCLVTPNGIIARERLAVQVGRNRILVAGIHAQEHKALRIIVHPNFNYNTIRHNIGLIMLATNILYTDYIQPICLWNRGEDLNPLVGSFGTVVGFGTDDHGYPYGTLLEARIPVVSVMTCIESNWDMITQYLTSDMFCAGNRDGVGPCVGDAGGGLYFNYNDIWFIRGLVSFTPYNDNTSMCDRKEFSVFTDVAKYLDWIEQPIELEPVSSLPHDCGKRKVPNFLIVNGTESKDGYWPWHAAIFRRDSASFDYACGGTILDQNTVLTAAHCLMASEGLIARERIRVQVGRNRLRVASRHAQEHKAFKLIVHPNFNRVRDDIGLIKLATNITYTDYVQPICLWNRGDDQNAIVGSLGTVVGFGIDENDNPSNKLLEAHLPVVSTITCIESNRQTFASQLTSNMFCAGSRDGSGPCNGDSGGGLFFNYNDVWFIRGLVSFTKHRRNSHFCDTKEYTVFTDVAKYLEWIDQPVGLTEASNLAQSCGKRKMPQSHSTESRHGYWPWHVAIYHNNAQTFNYACGGSILDQNTVLTAAHCLITSKGIIPPERLVLQLQRNQLRVAMNRPKEHGVFELFVHPEYNVNDHRHDIALIKLTVDITFSNYIQPICLWNRGKDQSAIIGSLGTVIGYDIYGTDDATDTLQDARIPVVSPITCIESNREAFTSKLTFDMFCAGNRNESIANNGENGGGLFFNYSNTWFIRGLASFTPPRQNMATKEYTVFTDVAKHLSWIMKHMRETEDQPIVTEKDENLKIRLLPMSTCGANPYASRDESSKPVLLGYPWMGLLEFNQAGSNNKTVKCQATLISDLYLISGASCISRLPKQYTLSTVRLGEYNKHTTTDCAEVDGKTVCSPPVQSLRIESVITHTGYNHSQHANNIALIRLRDRADTSQINVKPICLPVTNELRSQKSTHYTLTSWNFASSGHLLERSVREHIDSIECQKLYNDSLVSMEITISQICIKQQQENYSECKLPLSGAPIQLVQQVYGENRYVLYGVFSHGPRRCGFSYPDVYTSVASFVEWILENIQE